MTLGDGVTAFVAPRGFEAMAVRRSRLGCRIVEVAPGPAAAATLTGIEPNDIVVVLGLCGALRDHAVGDTVVYRSVAGSSGTVARGGAAVRDRARQLDAALAADCAAKLSAATVAACTTDHVVTTIAERRALSERYGADVVDMEGTHLAAALAARGVRFAMVRVVSDDAARDLPALEGAIRADGSVAAGRIALAFARAPRGALRFVRDVASALGTLTAVTRALACGDPPR